MVHQDEHFTIHQSQFTITFTHMGAENNQKSLKEAINELLKAYNLDGRLKEVRLINSWEKLMGKMIAKHTTKLYIRNGILHVHLDSAPLREELSYAREKILEKLNVEAGEKVIGDVRFL